MIAPVEDGKLVESTSAASLSQSTTKTSNSTVSKDQFLQLLVAQMKYQDPLEPTSNTEYISQYATFSELEQMQNMSASLEMARASQLVGQTVLLSVTDSAGRTTMIQGNVDYVVYENGKTYLSVNGELYSMDDLNTVADPAYLDAYAKAANFLNAYNKLPALAVLTIDDREAVEELNEIYQNMTEYEKKFIAPDYVSGLEKYVERMNELVKSAEQAEGSSGTDTEDADKEEGGEEIEGSEGEGTDAE